MTAAPFRHGPMIVKPDWIDYNGHLNMAYYHVLFDTCVDHFFEDIDLGEAYLARAKASFFTVEAHVCYLRELMAGDPVLATFQILSADDKRVHGFQELHHAEEGYLSATSEHVHLHVDMVAKKAAPLAADAASRLRAVADAHAAIPVSDRVGRSVRLKPR